MGVLHKNHFFICCFMGLVLLPTLFLSSKLYAKTQYKYSELQILDYDQIKKLVTDHIKKYQTLSAPQDEDEPEPPSQEAVEELRKALKLILSRPNQDNMLAKVLPDIRKELAKINSFEDSLASLTDEALAGLKNEKLQPVERATDLIILENILSEFKPEVVTQKSVKDLFETIQKAQVKIPNAVKKESHLRSMLKLISPSDRAKKILETSFPQSSVKK